MALSIILERFDWESPDQRTRISFRVTEMLLAISTGRLRHEFVTSPLNREFAEEWIQHCEINLDRVNNMTIERKNTPVLGAWYPDKTVILIDGSHRFWRRYLDREEWVDYCLVEFEDWRQYATIEGKWPE